jgi:hypothetical protein
MGTLIGWAYPTGMALNLADHTYVACGTGGKAWDCWGGKTGGSSIVQGPADEQSYQALFELRPGDAVTLGDPDVARAAYGTLEP